MSWGWLKCEGRRAKGEGRTMGAIRSFRELRVYQSVRDAAKQIFQLSRRFPGEEKFSLTSQIRRASRSVSANIAEAWRKRLYPASFVSKLSDSEAAEVCAWLDASLDCQYINQDEFNGLNDCYDHIGSQLRLMINNPEKWCTTAVENRRAKNKR